MRWRLKFLNLIRGYLAKVRALEGGESFFEKIRVGRRVSGAVGESGHLTLFTISLFHSKIKWCSTKAGKKEESQWPKKKRREG